MTVAQLNNKMKDFSKKFTDALEKKDFDKALEIGIDVLTDLTYIAKEDIVGVLSDTYVKGIAEDIVSSYEKTLSYIKGIIDGLKYVSPIYAIGEKERLVHILASAINELFSFIMGALIIVAELSSRSKRNSETTPGVV